MRKPHLIVFILLLCLACSKKKNDPVPSSNYEPTTLHISSVVTTPTASESISIKNNTGHDVAIGNYTLGDLNNPTAYNIPSTVVIHQGETRTFDHTTIGFQINDSGETIYFKDTYGVNVDTWSN
jgi:hypothetical protein